MEGKLSLMEIEAAQLRIYAKHELVQSLRSLDTTKLRREGRRG